MDNTVINIIDTLKNEIEQEIDNINELQMDVFQHIKKKSLESKLQRLEKISGILKIDKYKIVFIGTIGQGKTTAICHLFNLIGKFKRDEPINKKMIEINITEPLFPTGSGRTTLSEVIIKSNENTFIEIEPYTKEELIDLIKNFTESIYQNENKEGEAIPIELDRAIRTIIKFKKNQKIKDDTGKERLVDLAKYYAEKMNDKEFFDTAIKNANLDKRKYSQEESKLYYNQSENERTWLQKNLDNVNKGEENTFSIPKRIYVNVSKNITIGSNIEAFDSIIDTKGIDEIAIRKDLSEYIEKDDTICLFTTSYNDAPHANIRELLKYFLSQRSNLFENKFILFVLPQKTQPEQENDGDRTWDTGIGLKKAIILKVFEDLNINFKDENVLFFDSLRYYDDKLRLMQDYSDSDVQMDKDEILSKINNIIKNKTTQLENEIFDINNDFQLIKNGRIFSEEEIIIVNDISSQIQLFKELRSKLPSFVYDEFINEYVDYYARKYPAWNTKDAINRRFGTYSMRYIDTYNDAKVIAEGLDEEQMLRKFTNGIKNDIIDILENLANSIPDLKNFVIEIETRFGLLYDTFINDVGNEIEDYFRKQNSNIEFWRDMIERRGKGKGYNEDVCTFFKRNLQEIKTNIPGERVTADRILEEFAEKNWRKVILQLLNFFGK